MQGNEIGPRDRHRVERVAAKHISWTTATMRCEWAKGLHDVARRSAAASVRRMQPSGGGGLGWGWGMVKHTSCCA